ncbi:probable calcium-binding protein CML22 isoform X2 [Magnolia sinica]|uniref:probable calcium-binding protein CML22 isoform X2 n=1 Tax=Magnolia sinica TaxID=86752 RepID=UPI002659DF13|nr:probable calcium-binding protein CML22 isoform X2 [Magnolia sinica]
MCGPTCEQINLVFSPGTCPLYPSLKSFLSEKMGGLLSHWNSSNKYKRLDPELEWKISEAIKQRASSGPNTFRSINSIILRFPQFKQGLRNIRSVFKEYDEDSNGTIDHEELKKCLQKLQLHLTEKEVYDLYHSCDVDGNEGIQFNEFVVLLCLIYLLMEPSTAPSTTSRMGLPQLEATFDTIVEAFLFLDNNRDGKLNKNDMVRALNGASPLEKSPRHVSRRRFKEMDWRKNGKVSFKEFLYTFINWVGIDADDEREIPVTDH